MANDTGKFWGGLLLGSGIGVALGLILAPRSGKETRQLLKQSAVNLPANVQAAQKTAQKTIDEAVQQLQEAIAIGQEASRRLRYELTGDNRNGERT
ncbi:MAG: YtxH domain-containing protein [Oscillatoriales cyanobacterium SM2_2_1]|nr:YtxH domain-containing protein [Oscillatoriales cyanobacterium SM2_2_1]